MSFVQRLDAKRFARSLVAAWLIVNMHLGSFARAPGLYLTAAKWWILGKRVRARGQFAPLLARSSCAYQWWTLVKDGEKAPSIPGLPPIIALVAADRVASGLDETLASLIAEEVPAHLIGADARAELIRLADTIDWSAEPWLLPICAGDRLGAGAAQIYRAAMSGSTTAVIYADDDQIDVRGDRSKPYFKPVWNAELFQHHDYLTGACVVHAGREALMAAGQVPDWAGALVARAVADSGGAQNLQQVLHHRRIRSAPRMPLPAVQIAADLPRVSTIIATRNRVDLLETCIAGLEATRYPDLELIVVDNDSDDPITIDFLDALPARTRQGCTVRVLRHPGPFNYSAINNSAAATATGELLCLLNNDIEMLEPDWLAIMVTQALNDEVGAVGAQLLYPDGRLQHAGVVIGVGNAAGHAHRFLWPEEEGYFHRHALPQFVSAVTAACLVVKRDRFLAVGGLDETHFPVAFNDVDLCLRLNEHGWQSLYEPRAVLIHHESVSRGLDTDPVGAARFAKELASLQRRWRTDQIVDPFHHPQLSRASEQFVLAL